jgi:putative nucleotidyltransferase-like protein
MAELGEVGSLLLATGAAGLAWRRVRASSGLESAPVVETLRLAFRAHVLESAVHAHQLGEVMALLRAAKVPVLLGKGWAAARLYPEPGLRPYGDLDLYVTPQAHAAALAALRGPAIPPGPVDLHRGFSDLDDLGSETLFARSRTAALGDGEVSLFGPEDHLRLLCLHGLRHGLWRPLWLCDVAVTLESRPADFDWDRLRSGDRRRAEAVACALRLAQELLGARVEGIPVAGCGLPAWLIPAVLRQWGSGSGWREPMSSFLRRPAGVVRELRRHWPNPIEATVGVRAPFNDFPRLPFQLAFTAVRAARFGLGLPAELWRSVAR